MDSKPINACFSAAPAALEEVLPLLPPARPGDPLHWRSFPPEDLSFEVLVRDLFTEATRYAVATGLPAPISNGVLDFRELLAAPSTQLQHSAIRYGDSDYHGGWVTPNLWHVGCVAREAAPSEERPGFPCLVYRFYRGFTLLSLDAPTVSFGVTTRVEATFWARVISPLVQLRGVANAPAGWLCTFFAYCPGKPVAFFSRDPLPPELYALAHDSRVQPVYFPLRLVASEAIAAYHTFHLLRVTDAQWDALKELVGDGTVFPHESKRG